MLTQTRSAHSPSLLPSLGGGGGVIAHNAKQSDLPRPFLPPSSAAVCLVVAAIASAGTDMHGMKQNSGEV